MSDENRNYFRALFPLQKGEFLLVHLFLLFTIAIGMFYTVASTVGVTLFLNKLSQEALHQLLPWIYISTAVAMIVNTWAYRKLFTHFSRFALVVGAPLFFALSLLIFRALIPIFGNTSALYFILFVWIDTCGIFLGIVAYSYMGDFFNVSEARRLYGYIMGGSGIGAPLGGFLAVFLLNYTAVANLLWVSVAFLVLVIAIAYTIHKKGVPKAHQSVEVKKSNPPLFRKIFASKYLRIIFLIVALSALCTCVIVFQMFIVASQSLNQVALAKFMAKLFSYIGIAELIMSFLLARYILSRFGVIKNLLLQPIFFILGSVGFLLRPSLFFAASLKFVDAASLTGLSREMLFLPLSKRMRIYSQSIANGGVAPLGTALGGGVLLLLYFLKTPFEVYSVLILLLALLWIIQVKLLSSEYRRVLGLSLHRIAHDPLDLHRLLGCREARGYVGKILQADDTQRVVSILKLTPLATLRSLKEEVRGLLNHPDAIVLATALKIWGDLASKEEQDVIYQSLNDPRLEVRRSGIIALYRLGDTQAKERGRQEIRKLFSSTEVAQAIYLVGALKEVSFEPEIARLLESSHNEIQKAAIEASGRLATKPLLLKLITLLDSAPPLRGAIVRAFFILPHATLWEIFSMAIEQMGGEKALALFMTYPLRRGLSGEVALTKGARASLLAIEEKTRHDLETMVETYQQMGKETLSLRALVADGIYFKATALLFIWGVLYRRFELIEIPSILLAEEEHFVVTSFELLEATLPRSKFIQIKKTLRLFPLAKLPCRQEPSPSFITHEYITQLISGTFMKTPQHTCLEAILFLKQTELFKEINANYLVSIAEMMEEESYIKGEYLFKEGDLGDALFIIRSGSIKIEREGKEIACLGKGEVLGELALLDHQPRSAHALIMDDTELLRLNGQDFESVLRTHPEIAEALLKILAHRLRKTTRVN